MAGRTERAGKNRQKILGAALELFQTQGIKKVSISDIAQKAGITPATVYNRFGSKDALVREVVKAWYRRALEEYRSVLETDKPFEEKFRDLLSFKSDMAAATHAEFMLAASSDDPEIRRFLESEYMVEANKSVNRFFDEGREQGYIAPDLSTETVLRYSEIIRRGINAEAGLASDPEYTAKLLRELTPVILYGIFGKKKK